MKCQLVRSKKSATFLNSPFILAGFRSQSRLDWRDSGLEGYRKGGIQERRDSGMEGFRTGGIEEKRDTGKEGSGHEKCWTRGILERWNAGQVG